MPSVSMSSASGGSGVAKCHIINLETSEQVEALFNPKEITIKKSATWGEQGNSKTDTPMLEFTKGQNRTLSAALFFDGYTTGSSIASRVDALEKLMTIIPEKERPPFVEFVWGALQFKGVVTSLDNKYEGFFPDGRPYRATCTINLSEVSMEQIANS